MCRIAMLSVHTSPLNRPGTRDAGGMNVYIRAVSRELAQQGMEVDIFSRATDPNWPPIVELVPGVRVIHLPAGPIAPLPKGKLFELLPEFLWNLHRFTTQDGKGYQFIHSHYWLSGWVGMMLQSRWEAPLIAMFHTLSKVKNAMRPEEKESAQRITVEERVVAQADAIVAATEDERSHLIHRYGARPSRIAVIPEGVDLALFKPQDKEAARAQLGLAGHRILLFAGRMEPLKGVDLFLQAVALLPPELPVCALVVGGERESDPVREQLRSLAQRLGLDGRVRFLPAQAHQQLPLYYSAADLCVLPSYYESFGLVPLEALACGTPVIAASVGGLASLLRDGDNGIAVSSHTPEAFAGSIVQALSDPPLLARLSRQARPSALRYQWVTVADQLIALQGNLTAQEKYGIPCFCEAR